MEKPNMLLHKSNPQLLRRLKDGAIVLAARRRRHILGAAPGRPEHVVDEREEGVRAHGHICEFPKPLLAFLGCEILGDVALFEVGFEVLALDSLLRD